jgi:N-acetylmuramoyl-L-alanine amidase CwlA
MYQIRQQFIAKNRSNMALKPIGIVLHETATPGATDENEQKYFNNNKVGASAHAFVDWDSITQTIPWLEKGWHACEPANSMFLGVELCHATTPQQFVEVWKRGVWLFAYLYVNVLKITSVTKANLMSHQEVGLKWKKTTHVDPVAYFGEFGKKVDDFRRDVQTEINNMIGKTNPQSNTQKGMLYNTTTLACKAKPSNSAITNGMLRKGVHEPITIYGETINENIKWYLVSNSTAYQQWIAAHYVQIIQ